MRGCARESDATLRNTSRVYSRSRAHNACARTAASVHAACAEIASSIEPSMPRLSARFFRRFNCRKTTKPMKLDVARCNLTLCQAHFFSRFFFSRVKIDPNLCRIRTCTAFTREKNNSVKFRKLREKLERGNNLYVWFKPARDCGEWKLLEIDWCPGSSSLVMRLHNAIANDGGREKGMIASPSRRLCLTTMFNYHGTLIGRTSTSSRSLLSIRHVGQKRMPRMSTPTRVAGRIVRRERIWAFDWSLIDSRRRILIRSRAGSASLNKAILAKLILLIIACLAIDKRLS